MKKLIFSAIFLLIGTISLAQQKVTVLEEARVKFSPFSLVENAAGSHSYLVSVKESYSGEFHENPIAFMKNNFDSKSFIEYAGKDGFDAYTVTFKSKKGTLEAKFGEDGELLNTRQNYKNILVSEEMRYYLYKNYKGWEIVKNKYVASGNGDQIGKEIYQFKFKKGNKRKSVKVKPEELLSVAEVASK